MTKGRHRGIKKEKISRIVDNHIEEVIEQLQEHVHPCLDSYEEFLKMEMEWIERQKSFQEIYSKRLS